MTGSASLLCFNPGDDESHSMGEHMIMFLSVVSLLKTIGFSFTGQIFSWLTVCLSVRPQKCTIGFATGPV